MVGLNRPSTPPGMPPPSARRNPSKLCFGTVCSSNINRSMEAHVRLQNAGMLKKWSVYVILLDLFTIVVPYLCKFGAHHFISLLIFTSSWCLCATNNKHFTEHSIYHRISSTTTTTHITQEWEWKATAQEHKSVSPESRQWNHVTLNLVHPTPICINLYRKRVKMWRILCTMVCCSYVSVVLLSR